MLPIIHIDPNEFPDSFASRNARASKYAEWFETLNLEWHVTANFNRVTTYEAGRRKLREWSARVDRKLFGRLYHKKTHEERMFFVAVPESSGASQNLHYHILARIPPEKHELFECFSVPIWKDLNPNGSLHVQRIGDTNEDRRKVIGYDLKDAWQKDTLPSIIFSSEFSNK
jgi:hypothetical protein